MKTNGIIMTASILLAVTTFASCDVKDEIHDKAAVRFTADIGGQTTHSRASGTTWSNGDAIGIFMVANGTTDIVSNNGNMRYTTAGDGTFTADAGSEIYYPMDGSAVDFIAYYPYTSTSNFINPIIVDVSNQTNQPAIDFLYASVNNGGNGYTKDYAGNVALTFTHKLAKIVMNCTADASVGHDLAGMDVTIHGMGKSVFYHLDSDSFEILTVNGDIVPRTVQDGSVYDAIILPVAYADGDVTVEFTLADGSGDTFTWDVGAATFESGNEYTYNVTLTRTGVKVTGTITPWTTIDRGDVLAE